MKMIIIKTQFPYFYNSEKGWDVLEKFRKAAGKSGYPNTNAFNGRIG